MFCTSACYLRRFGKIQGSAVLDNLSVWGTNMCVQIEKYSFIYADCIFSYTFIQNNFLFFFARRSLGVGGYYLFFSKYALGL